MKKQIMTIALVLGLCMTALAQQAGGGLFYRGKRSGLDVNRDQLGSDPFYLPHHGEVLNGDANDAPLGGGALLLIGLGAAYAMTKRKKEN